jgi:hypothetical protein
MADPFYASVLIDAGESVRAVADYLGHNDPGFTLRAYSHLFPSSDDRARRAIDAILPTSPGDPWLSACLEDVVGSGTDKCPVVVSGADLLEESEVDQACDCDVGCLVCDAQDSSRSVDAEPLDSTFPYYARVGEAEDLPEILRQQVEHFFTHYKDLEPEKWVRVGRWGDADEAKAVLMEAIERAKAGAAASS